MNEQLETILSILESLPENALPIPGIVVTDMVRGLFASLAEQRANQSEMNLIYLRRDIAARLLTDEGLDEHEAIRKADSLVRALRKFEAQ